MPRRPTGMPTGRPKGSGTLGAVKRFTVHLPTALYQQIELLAEGRSYTRGTPALSGCVRDLLTHALACPYKRQTVWPGNGQTGSHPTPPTDERQQTKSLPLQRVDTLAQIENDSVPSRDGKKQREIVPTVPSDDLQQRENILISAEESLTQTTSLPAVAAPSRRGRPKVSTCTHPPERWNAKRRMCMDCEAEKGRAKTQAKRQARAERLAILTALDQVIEEVRRGD